MIAEQNVFYMSSMHLHKIVNISMQGKVTDFVPSDKYNLLPVLGIRIDDRDGSVWAASWLDHGKTELLHFDANGALLGRFPPPGQTKHGLNDLVVLPNGHILVTDTEGNAVFDFDGAAHSFRELKFARPLLQPNGIALSGDGQAAYIADAIGVLRLSLASNESAEVDPGPKSTLAGADGLYWHDGKLVAVQNGIGSARIAAFQLSPDGLRVVKTSVLEYRSPLCILPTTGAFDGDDFYYMVDSQLDNLNGDKILDVTRLKPVRIAKLKIPSTLP